MKLWDKGYVKSDFLELQPSEFNKSEENRIAAVTSIAAISRGKDKSNNPQKRYQSLLVEAASNDFNDLKGVAGRPFEFIPVFTNIRYVLTEKDIFVELFYKNEIIAKMNIEKFNNLIMPFSYNESGRLYTNMRALLNAGIEYEKIPYNTEEELKDFKIVKIKAPHFVFDQLYTHTQLSKIAVSERVVSVDDYWLPLDFVDRFKNYYDQRDGEMLQYEHDLRKILTDSFDFVKKWIFKNLSTKQFYDLMKELKYPKEIYQRFHYGLKYKEFIMAGWANDPKRWEHLLIERGAVDGYKNWTQETTKEVAKAIKAELGF